jgi:pyruvate formate lyase activating enzyme
MQIGGVQKLSLGDYPGKTSVVIFTIGCNMRCSFCHNPELVLPERFVDVIPTEEVLDFLASV